MHWYHTAPIVITNSVNVKDFVLNDTNMVRNLISVRYNEGLSIKEAFGRADFAMYLFLPYLTPPVFFTGPV
jgi:hypothetical protein